MVKRGILLSPEGRKAGRIQRTFPALEKPMGKQGVKIHTGRNCTICKDGTKTINPEKGKSKHTHQTPKRATKRGEILAGNKLGVQSVRCSYAGKCIQK